jgi:hypothetical protein
MMIFMYFCVMVSALAPNGEHLARYYVSTIENQYRAFVETRAAIADEMADMRALAG